MAEQTEFRRYLVNVDAGSTSQLFTDCLIIGSGIAGLRAAIEAAEHQQQVILVCKGPLEDSNTWKAQGGIVWVREKDDSPASHAADTISTGCGLCDEKVVDLVVSHSGELLEQLLKWGVEFDFIDGRIATTLEGGHSHFRIAHAHGDETGRMIAMVLIKKMQQNPNIRVMQNFFAVDLLANGSNACVGAIGSGNRGRQIIWAINTILATGGAGQLYRETTNPSVATADGIAMAYRAGAVLTDLEFMQFHPTTLYVAGASRALISEALRGEGAVLRDTKGKAFMSEYHSDAELAPRDVVSRAILNQMLKTKSTHVYLDIRHFDKEHFAQRFPFISELCESFDIDVSKDMIPVRPSAHYMLGGVKTDASAKTSIDNLYACGEVAATGLHGANRLGSNSLLEGLVFGTIAARQISKTDKHDSGQIKHPSIKYHIPHSDRTRLDTDDVRNSLRALMWRNVGITRTERQLTEAQEIIRFWQRYVMDKVFDSPQGWQCQNMLTVSLLMAEAAQQRKESRGVHFRRDFTETDDLNFKKHIEITKNL